MSRNDWLIFGGLIMFGFSMFAAKKYLIPKKGEKYLPLFRKSENEYKLPENLLVRIAQQESYFDPNASNPSGAVGMMQIIPRWHPELKDPYDPNQAVPYAANFLRQLYIQFKRWDYAVMAYNWGPGNLKKWIAAGADFKKLPKETQNYVTNVSKDVRLV